MTVLHTSCRFQGWGYILTSPAWKLDIINPLMSLTGGRRAPLQTLIGVKKLRHEGRLLLEYWNEPGVVSMEDDYIIKTVCLKYGVSSRMCTPARANSSMDLSFQM